MNPDRFAEKVRGMRFASPNTDVDLVSALYRRIFPRLAQHKSLIVYVWGDEDARLFLENLGDLMGLKNLVILNWRDRGCTEEISADMKRELAAAVKQRGGTVEYQTKWGFPGSGEML